MRAAWRLERLARLLERDYESAARSLREGIAEMFTLQRLKLPPSLYKCRATTNLTESPQSGVARRTASALLLTENRFRKSPAIVTCGRWPGFSDAKPRLKSRRRK
jgi:hypothetical protein